MQQIPIEISARHLHLSQKDLEILFGIGYKLRTHKQLSQPGEFSAKETVSIFGAKGKYTGVRIIGPVRTQTQLEITITDSFSLGIKPPTVSVSGNLARSSGGLKIVGTKGDLELKKGIIVAQRHLHISPDEAKKIGLKHLDAVSIKTTGVRSVIFNNVIVRSRQNKDKLSFQLDTDEANTAEVKNGDVGEIII